MGKAKLRMGSMPLLSEVADNFSDIAADRCGCCVVQRCVDVAQGDTKSHLLNQIAANALFLSENPYGNYVVQYVIDGKIPHACATLIQNLQGYFVSLSMNKYGSNVVEKCLKELSNDQSVGIIIEIMTSRDFLTVLQDPYGNFVAQTALRRSQDIGQVHDTLVELILRHYPFLNSHPHGKRVLARARDFKNNNRPFKI
ncbi:Pumilio RNA-binding repeat [Dillenia turbinata]|uniref:Pumilio RNA-binding repeat n=1 Tax=Dillenia turbinata TaxID=194707 RepID=A0AAN8WCD9_9MAGN